jgi:alcohol dehydrogenase (NADP+)
VPVRPRGAKLTAMKTRAYGTTAADQPLAPLEIDRRELRPDDVLIDVLFAGICHSDIHQARGEWGNSTFPMVPGHEIVGRVARVGDRVTKLKVGDLAGVGCMVDSCRTCHPCEQGYEQFCEQGTAWTYNSTEMDRVTPTHGGYSQQVVVTEHFTVRVPESLDPAGAAPLLCAGITTYSPLRQWNCKKGDRVGVIGLGGLGHMAVKLAAAMGAEVTMLSTSPSKKADATRLGASGFELTTEPGALKRLTGRFDLLIDTVSAPHELGPYLAMLRPYGAMSVVGLPSTPSKLNMFSLVNGNKRLAGSSIGGMPETQEMLEFCAEHRIVSDVEVIPASSINDAYERTIRGDVRYRFSIDAATL